MAVLSSVFKVGDNKFAVPETSVQHNSFEVDTASSTRIENKNVH